MKIVKVGLTGGIGSGKSLVSRLFATLGIPIYYADQRGKWLMNHNELVKEQVQNLFGKEAYQNGELNRAYLAGIVFSTPEKLAQLNAIIHPAVALDSIEWFAKQSQIYAVKEAAILFEAGTAKAFDKIITVTAPESLRIQRVMKRDSVTKEAVKKRLAQQWPEEKKVELSDFVIVNDEIQAVIPQVWQIHQTLLKN